MLNGAADGLEWFRVPGLRFNVVCTLLVHPVVTVVQKLHYYSVTMVKCYNVTVLQYYNVIPEVKSSS